MTAAKLTPEQQARLAAQQEKAAPLGSKANPIPVASIITADDMDSAGVVHAEVDDAGMIRLTVSLGHERQVYGAGPKDRKVAAARERMADSFKSAGFRLYVDFGGRIEPVTFTVNASTAQLTPTPQEKAEWSPAKAAKPGRTLAEL